MGKILDQAQAISAAIDAKIDAQTDEEALNDKVLYPLWKAGAQALLGSRMQYGGKLYKCMQAHTTQADWTPSATPALWVEIAAPGAYRQIKVDMLSTEAFALNEIGWWQTEGNLYKSLIAANVYTPESYAAGWQKV